MAYTTINKSTAYQNSIIINGNGSTQALTGVGHQPDWIWMKRSNATGHHRLIDTVRGISKIINADLNNSEATTASYVTAIGTDGWTVGNNTDVNASGGVTSGWSWRAGQGTTTNPSGGTITTTASVDTTAGLSIFTYTGTGNAAHLAHGLGVAPTVVWIKGRTNTDQWFVKHPGLNANQYVYLNGTGAATSGANVWSATNPDATKIYVGTDAGVYGSGEDYVCYAFAEKRGYSKFGTYKGNNNSDGVFVYTGFKPSFLLIRRAAGSQNCVIIDNKITGYNGVATGDSQILRPNTADAQTENNGVDLLSNGFKCRSSDGDTNGYSDTYIYMAFGQSLVGTNNIPASAR